MLVSSGARSVMSEKIIRLEFCFGTRSLRVFLTLVMLFCEAREVASESVALTTYYPSPSGVYTLLIATSNAFLARDTGYLDVGTNVAPSPGTKLVVMNGNVGLGTTSPAATLDVQGNAIISGSITAASLNASGPITAAGLITSTYSDVRLKDDITPISGALALVSRLTPVRFKWKREFASSRHLSGGAQWGLVAQDVERVLPEVVSKDATGYLRLTYGNQFNMLELAAVKELSRKVDSDQVRLDDLEAKLYGARK